MLHNSRFIFFGTPEFAAIILKKLIDADLAPAAVVCNPDRPVGRKKIITPPPVKTRIMNYKLGIRNKIKVIQPEKLDSEFHNSLFMLHNSMPFDFFIVAAYAKILPKEIIHLPRLGAIGVHPSLLPKYRGPTPIQTAILNGEKETGATVFLMDEKVDHGPVLRNEKLEIRDEDNYGSLLKRLAELSANLLIKTLPQYLKGEIKPRPQNGSEATYTKKFTTQDAYINPEILRQVLRPRAQDREVQDGANLEGAINIERRIRALNPKPGVWTIQDGKRIKLLEAELIDGRLKLKKIQIEGKKPKGVGLS